MSHLLLLLCLLLFPLPLLLLLHFPLLLHLLLHNQTVIIQLKSVFRPSQDMHILAYHKILMTDRYFISDFKCSNRCNNWHLWWFPLRQYDATKHFVLYTMLYTSHFWQSHLVFQHLCQDTNHYFSSLLPVYNSVIKH